MKRIATLTLIVAGALAASGGVANAVEVTPTAPTSLTSISIALPLGSGHNYTGTIDTCTGAFTATGVTVGYTENVTGTLIGSDLDFTSVYVGDVNDGLGLWNPYTFSTDAVVYEGGSFIGTALVTKTSTMPDSVPVNEGPYDATGTVTVGDTGCHLASTIANAHLKTLNAEQTAACKEAWGAAKNWHGKYLSATSQAYPSAFSDSFLAEVTEAVTAACEAGNYAP